MPGWWDDDDFYHDELYDPETGSIVSVMGVYYDTFTHQWRCHCHQFKQDGHCPHLVPFRRVRELEVKEEYL